MGIENNEVLRYSLTQALAEIEAIRSQINAMGANDSEFATLNLIIQKLTNREITPEEAGAQARGVRDTKQAYH